MGTECSDMISCGRSSNLEDNREIISRGTPKSGLQQRRYIASKKDLSLLDQKNALQASCASTRDSMALSATEMTQSPCEAVKRHLSLSTAASNTVTKEQIEMLRLQREKQVKHRSEKSARKLDKNQMIEVSHLENTGFDSSGTDDDDILQLEAQKRKERKRKEKREQLQKQKQAEKEKRLQLQKNEQARATETAIRTASFDRKRNQILERHGQPDGLDAIFERASISELASFPNRSPSAESRNALKMSIISTKSYSNVKEDSKIMSPKEGWNPLVGRQSHRPQITSSTTMKLETQHIEEEDEYDYDSRNRLPKGKTQVKVSKQQQECPSDKTCRVRQRDQPKRSTEKQQRDQDQPMSDSEQYQKHSSQCFCGKDEKTEFHDQLAANDQSVSQTSNWHKQQLVDILDQVKAFSGKESPRHDPIDKKDFHTSHESVELYKGLVNDITPTHETQLRRSVSRNFDCPQEKSLLDDDESEDSLEDEVTPGSEQNPQLLQNLLQDHDNEQEETKKDSGVKKFELRESPSLRQSQAEKDKAKRINNDMRTQMGTQDELESLQHNQKPGRAPINKQSVLKTPTNVRGNNRCSKAVSLQGFGNFRAAQRRGSINGPQKKDSLMKLKRDANAVRETTFSSKGSQNSKQDKSESSCEFVENEQFTSRGTEAFLKNPEVCSNNSCCDERSGKNMEPAKGIFGNRFENHDPHSTQSFYMMNQEKVHTLMKKRGMSQIQLSMSRKGNHDEAQNDLFAQINMVRSNSQLPTNSAV